MLNAEGLSVVVFASLPDEVVEESVVSPTRPVATLTEDQAMAVDTSPSLQAGEKRSLTSPGDSSSAKRARSVNLSLQRLLGQLEPSSHPMLPWKNQTRDLLLIVVHSRKMFRREESK